MRNIKNLSDKQVWGVFIIIEPKSSWVLALSLPLHSEYLLAS